MPTLGQLTLGDPARPLVGFRRGQLGTVVGFSEADDPPKCRDEEGYRIRKDPTTGEVLRDAGTTMVQVRFPAEPLGTDRPIRYFPVQSYWPESLERA